MSTVMTCHTSCSKFFSNVASIENFANGDKMKLQLLNLNDFMVVESLAYHKSFNVAANELIMSPSALSRQLSSIESKLETIIFDRDTRNFSLTSTGIELAQAAKRILHQTEEKLGCFEPYLKARLSRLTISTLPSITGVLLPRLLNGFIKIHPHVCLEINDENPSELIEAIESGHVDIGLTTGTIPIRSKLSFLPFFEENFVALSNKRDSSMSKDEYTLEEILEMPVISGKKGTSLRDYIDSVCEREKLFFAPQVEVSQLDTAVSMVVEGLGITILPTLILPILSTKNLKFHRVAKFNVPNCIGIAFSSTRALPSIAQSFVNHVQKEIKPLYQSIRTEFSI